MTKKNPTENLWDIAQKIANSPAPEGYKTWAHYIASLGDDTVYPESQEAAEDHEGDTIAHYIAKQK